MPRVLIPLIFIVILGFGWVSTCASRHMASVSSGIEALSSREFETLTLVTVGTGGAYENHQRRGPCVAVGLGSELILVDAGRAVAEGMRAVRIPLTQAHTVLLTSLLPENTVGLDDLLLTGWLEGRRVPLRLIGPAGTKEFALALEAAHRGAIQALSSERGLSLDGARLEAVEVTEGWSEPRGDLRITMAFLPGGPLPGLAWRFDAGGRSAVIGGSGWGEERLTDLAQGADVLVHEALVRSSLDAALSEGIEGAEQLRREAEHHTSLAQVGGIATRSGVEGLVLLRLRPPPYFDHQFTRVVGETFSGRVFIAEDGDEIIP